MKKIGRGILSKYSIYSHTSLLDEKDVDHQIGSITKERTIQMAKDSFISEFKKLKYNGDRMQIKMDSGNHVLFYIERDYSATNEKDSETFTQFLNTNCGNRNIKSRKRTYKNPEYELNPECEFCNKLVIKVVPAKNVKGKVLMVCIKCKPQLDLVVKIHNNYQTKHEVKTNE